MDKLRHKSKKEKPSKHVERDKPPSFISDVKAIKENIKIKEILRTVKMNSSMRLKAPRGSKVMQNKDFHDSDDIFDSTSSTEDVDLAEIQSATNTDVVLNHSAINNTDDKVDVVEEKSDQANGQIISEVFICDDGDAQNILEENQTLPDSDSLSETVIEQEGAQIPETLTPPLSDSLPNVKVRDRKLSLDQTMLTRREGLQSEWDLNSIGKSPLERKSSFFKKKLDSFFKNTTEIFKRQSSNKSQSSIQRRSSLSMSLQSLNEKCNCDFDILHKNEDEYQGSGTSLQSSTTPGRSNSSLSQSDRGNLEDVSERTSLAGSRPLLVASQPLEHSNSINSLNEAYLQESLLNSRAISMSSGLDSALGQKRRKANRSNRVTWLASEGLTNYLRRVIQDEKCREMQMCNSYQDFTTIPENQNTSKTDSKGRRLSYQRAVSGEDPVMRYQDSSLRKKQIPENSQANYELSRFLAEYSLTGIPLLVENCIIRIPDVAFAYLQWAENPQHMAEFFNWRKLLSMQLSANDNSRQSAIKELVITEADYIKHLMCIVEVFIATAHALQHRGKLLNVDTSRLFTNIPDVLNANLVFWETTISPMLEDAVRRQSTFNSQLMAPGFFRFPHLFSPYRQYVNDHIKALEYLRSLGADVEFMTYLSWCHAQKTCNRLLLPDIMIKPMQRLTKYSLLLRRIATHTDYEPERGTLLDMETVTKSYVLDVNRTMQKKQELEMIDKLMNEIEPFEIEFKDEDVEKCFRMFSMLDLRAPMPGCRLRHCRSLIYQGDLRFRDNIKDSRGPWSDVRVYLLTDMMLICKKLNKGQRYQYKMIRPKYMLDRLMVFPRCAPRTDEMQTIIFVVTDGVGSSYHGFALTHSTKDVLASVKMWEQKIREAKLTLEIGLWLGRDPAREISDLEIEASLEEAAAASSDSPSRNTPAAKELAEDLQLEREAIERVAAMLHKIDDDPTDIEDVDADADDPRPTMQNIRVAMRLASIGGRKYNSRLSSFNKSSSNEEPQPGPSHQPNKPGGSGEPAVAPTLPENAVATITVNVEGVSDSENTPPHQPTPPRRAASPRAYSPSRNTLRVQPQVGVMALVHSLPDLSIDPVMQPPKPPPRQEPLTASEKLYKSHNELLEKNRLAAARQQYLSPDRGASYPPPSPTRGSLMRGTAISYPAKNPPLSKMGHVNSQSQSQMEPVPSTSQGIKNDRRSPSPEPSTSTGITEKKSKNVASRPQADIALIGLAVMGQNLILNMNDHGFVVCAYNRTVAKVTEFLENEAKGTKVIGANSLEDMVAKLKKPRKVMLLVKAGSAVDAFVRNLLPLLEKGDIIIDGGNSQYIDTQRWCKELANSGIYYIGMGVSGGEDGARYGPSLMPGGHTAAWPHVKPIFQAISAKANDEPCCDWVGEDGAGHFVKMVHNGIEYGDMQLISEAYNLMKDVLGLGQDEMAAVFEEWNKGELDSFLIEITRDILKFKDTDGQFLLPKILDTAGQKGTGKWTGIAALEYGVPVTLIGEAVFARCLSALKDERVKASKVLPGSTIKFTGNKKEFLEHLRKALYASKLISYAQGFMLLREAAKVNNWNLNYGSVALMWRGGCIIRSVFLGNIKDAFTKNPQLSNLLLDPYFSERISASQASLRQVVAQTALVGVPAPAFSAALAFYDGYRSAVLPANMLQAQRDYFGAHTYELITKPGDFVHTNWTGHGGNVSASTYTT